MSLSQDSDVEPTVDSASPSRRRAVVVCMLAILILVVCILAVFWPVMSDEPRSRLLGTGDSWVYAGPTQYFLDDRLHAGELPLWNPLVFCGQPFAANPQSFMFYPLNLARSLLTFSPTPWKTHVGFVIMVFLHLVIGGFGTFLLARHHRLSFAACLVAAMAYALSCPALSRAIGHWYFHFMLAWLPWLLLALQKAFEAETRRSRIRFASAAGLAYGVTILGGTPHFMVLFPLVLGCAWLLHELSSAPWHLFATRQEATAEPADSGKPAGLRPPPEKKRRGRKANAKKGAAQKRWRTWVSLVWLFTRRTGVPAGRNAALLVLCGVIGVLVAMPLLLPAQEFAGFSARNAKGIDMEQGQHPGPVWNPVQMLAVYSGDMTYEGIKAAGAGVLLLALCSLVHIRRRGTLLYLVLFLMLMDCALESPLIIGRLVAWVSPYQMSEPGRAMCAACLPLAILAGMGLDAVLGRKGYEGVKGSERDSRRWRILRTAWVLAAGVAVLAVVARTAYPHPFLTASVWILLLPGLALAILLVAGWIPSPWVRAAAGYAVAGLVFAEVFVWSQLLLPFFLNPANLYPNNLDTLAQPAELWNDNQRAIELKPNVNMYKLTGITNGYDPLTIQTVHQTLCAPEYEQRYFRTLSPWEPSRTQQRGNLFLKRAFWLAKQYVEGPLPPKKTLFPSTTTVFLSDPGNVPIRKVARDTLRRSAVSTNVDEAVLLSKSSPPHTIPVVSDKTKQMALSNIEIKVEGIHTALRLTVASTCRVDLQVGLEKPGGKWALLGSQLHLVAGEKDRTFEMPMPDYDVVQLVLAPKFLKDEGTIWVREITFLRDREDEDHLLRVTSRGANHAEVEVGELKEPRILTFVDAFYPGWSATVDGQPVPILRANDVFKAVVVPAGRHTVRFTFSSWRVYAGIAISLTTILGVMFVVSGFPRKRNT